MAPGHDARDHAPMDRPSLRTPERDARIRNVVCALLLLLLADSVLLFPLWLESLKGADGTVGGYALYVPIACGIGIALVSFQITVRAMANLTGRIADSDRGLFAQSSLGVSLAMFYVVAVAIPLTAVLLGANELPSSGAELSAILQDDSSVPSMSPVARHVVAQGLVFSTMLSFVGASFYIANRLREGSTSERTEPFDPLRFWSGLWFRLGQAMLYTFGAFIYLWCSEVHGDGDTAGFRALPLVGLFIGMFVRAAEALVLGLADRAFRTVERFVGPSKSADPAQSERDTQPAA